jgi:predicted Zn-dependent protease
MMLYDAVLAQSHNALSLASDLEIPKAIQQMAENLTALAKAPVGETYSGPVLFEGMAGPQLMAQVLGRNLSLFRKPVTEPGRPGGFPASEFEGRIGSRILPEWIDVVDDPTQTEWRGRPLFGHYTVDMEGVAPQPLSIVEKGVLKNFLLTRQPVKNYNASNGRARLPGSFGAHSASISNLFVQARETTPAADLKKKLLEMISARSKPYGILVRKLDFPSAASLDEIRSLLAGAARSGGGIPLSSPILIYRVYPDGREELVRGMRFRGVNARTLRDIQAASDDMHVLEYLDSPAPFALIGAGGFITETCVVAPSLLIDDVDLVKAEDQLPKLPIVPPPS